MSASRVRTAPPVTAGPAGGPCRTDQPVRRHRLPDPPRREVADFDPGRYADNRALVQTDRWTHLGFAATALALADAGLPERATDPYGWAVTLASASGGNLFGQRELQRLWSSPSRTVGAYQSIAWFYAASVGQLSIRHQAKGRAGCWWRSRRVAWTAWRTRCGPCGAVPRWCSPGRPSVR